MARKRDLDHTILAPRIRKEKAQAEKLLVSAEELAKTHHDHMKDCDICTSLYAEWTKTLKDFIELLDQAERSEFIFPKDVGLKIVKAATKLNEQLKRFKIGRHEE
jgi:hypothetical protein